MNSNQSSEENYNNDHFENYSEFQIITLVQKSLFLHEDDDLEELSILIKDKIKNKLVYSHLKLA